jgi:hypothetical protein
MFDNNIVEPKEPPKQAIKKTRRKLSGRKMSLQQFLQIQHGDISGLLSTELRSSLGEIEEGFDMFVYGGSGEGKSTFSLKAVMELSQLGRVLHLVYEEGHSKSVQKNLQRSGLVQMVKDVKLPNGYDLMDGGTFEDLQWLLGKKKSPKIIVIDSWQYSRFTREQWFVLKNKYIKGRRKKIFIIISHADGKKPRGASAIDIMYDAQIKVFVKGKIAFIKSRYEGIQNYVIYEKLAKEYWGRKFNSMLTKQIF